MRVLSRGCTSVPWRTSRYRANLFTTEHCLTGGALRLPNQRLHSTQNGIQSSAGHWQRPSNSPWTPRVSWQQRRGVARGEMFNTADMIRNQLNEDGHRVWGFVVYRCTYGDDAAWETFLERMHTRIRRYMEYNDGLNLLDKDCFKLTVLEDANKFDGASTQFVREHFKEWRKLAVREEQGTREEVEARRVKPEPIYHPWGESKPSRFILEGIQPPEDLTPPMGNRWTGHHEYGQHVAAVRYTFCVQIDEEALQSIVSTEGEEVAGKAWVNLIEVDWDNNEAMIAAREREYEELKKDYLERGIAWQDVFDDTPEVFPEIDDCIEEKVGWMKVQYGSLIPDTYSHLQDPNTLHEYLYTRPPDILNEI
jgi:hypothetical protein